MGVGENAATGLALIIHELATNSLKYGALSSPTGTLDLSGRMVGDNLEISWSQQGGPPISAPHGNGYGSKLIERTMSGVLGGQASYWWPPSGAVVTLTMNGSRLNS